MPALGQSALGRTWQDLTTGRNLDVYVLAITAAGFAIYSFFNEPRIGVAFALASLYCAEVLRVRHKEASADAAIKLLTQRIDNLIQRLEDPELDHEQAKFESNTSQRGLLPQEGRPLS